MHCYANNNIYVLQRYVCLCAYTCERSIANAYGKFITKLIQLT